MVPSLSPTGVRTKVYRGMNRQTLLKMPVPVRTRRAHGALDGSRIVEQPQKEKGEMWSSHKKKKRGTMDCG